MFVSHNFTSPLLLADASQRLSGLKATAFTQPVCPESFGISRPVATCQSLIVRSFVPAASHLPSWLKATEKKLAE